MLLSFKLLVTSSLASSKKSLNDLTLLKVDTKLNDTFLRLVKSVTKWWQSALEWQNMPYLSYKTKKDF